MNGAAHTLPISDTPETGLGTFAATFDVRQIAALDVSSRQYVLGYVVDHMVFAHEWRHVLFLLSCFRFLEAKCWSAGVYELLRDFQTALDVLPVVHEARRWLTDLYRAVDTNAHLLNTDRSLLFQQLYNALAFACHPPSKALEDKLRFEAQHHCRPWLKRVTAPATMPDPDLLRVLRGHSGGGNISDLRRCF
jgi:hypothetical protein